MCVWFKINWFSYSFILFISSHRSVILDLRHTAEEIVVQILTLSHPEYIDGLFDGLFCFWSKKTIFHRNFTIPITLCSSHTSLLHKFETFFLKVYIHQLRSQQRFLVSLFLALTLSSTRDVSPHLNTFSEVTLLEIKTVLNGYIFSNIVWKKFVSKGCTI